MNSIIVIHPYKYEGMWYFAPSLDMEGWLCPALFKYFDEAPTKLYAQFKRKGE